jgi:thiamine phosphate synthase YjbQ (UPF0047 family)
MISRERLLAGLRELAYVEEGMVTMFANFAKAMLKETEEVEEGKKKEMEKLLTRLYNDSFRHKETVDGLIRQVEAEDKNEY